MSRASGSIRQSQVITTYGPGALIDLPTHSAIVGGLDTWPQGLPEIVEQRLSRALQRITDVPAPKLYAPPPAPSEPWAPAKGIGAWRFPEWFVVQERSGTTSDDGGRPQSRRLVPRKALDERGEFERLAVVPTRFVRACPRGHVDDLDWYAFVHGPDSPCRRQLWLDERGTTGGLGELTVRCECGKSRNLSEASDIGANPLGKCRGARPWLGRNMNEECDQISRLLIRTATNAYFPQVASVLSLPDTGTAVQEAVVSVWDVLQAVQDAGMLSTFKAIPMVAQALGPFDDEQILRAIDEVRTGTGQTRPLKEAELEALLRAPEGYGDEPPLDANFHACRLPDSAWRTGTDNGDRIASVVQLHRLREVLALIGFTRLDAVTPDIHGDFESDVMRAEIALEPQWFPAVENRGEGVFVELRAEAVATWLKRPPVAARVAQLAKGYALWLRDRNTQRPFPGGAYVLLHTLAHLLVQALAMRCGYPASSIRERIYAEETPNGRHYGILLYTGTPDAEGTLGGLVQQGRHIEDHLEDALRTAALCSNDPICAQHAPDEGTGLESRPLHGAACHGCSLIAETSCEMRNDFLDRALVVPVLGLEDAAFFQLPE